MVWIPKQRLCTTNVGQKHEPREFNNQEPPNILTKKNRPTEYRWQKKEKVITSKRVIRMNNNRDKELKNQLWVKKQQSNPKSQDQQHELSKQIKNIPSREMQLRIAILQALLFGMASIKGNTAPSATNCHLILVT